MVMMFEDAGEDYQILSCAEQGWEVLQKLAVDNTINFLLLDVHMPATNCEELVLEILQQHPDVKILAISVSDDVNIIQKLLNSGMHGYISKFASLAEIIKAIDTICSGQIYLSLEMQLKLKQ